MKIAPIVEGHGEVEAVPVLLRRLVGERATILRPIRVPRGRMVKTAELQRAVQLARMRLERSDGILVLLDADDDCPAQLGTDLLAAASALGGPKVAVVAAVREFEAWYLAAAASLVAEGRLAAGATPPLEPEAVPDAKGWLSLAMGRRYSETLDQPAFAALFDVEAASRARSFAKLRRDLDRLLHHP